MQYCRRVVGIQFVRRDVCVDFGCGVGRLSHAFKEHFDHVIGVDVSQRMIAQARRRHIDIQFLCNQRANLAIMDSSSVDFIYSNIVLQHLDNRMKRIYIREFGRILRPEGWAVFQFPSKSPPKSAIRMGKDALKSVMGPSLERCVRILLGKPDKPERIKTPMYEAHELNALLTVILARMRCAHIAYTNSTDRNFAGKLEFFRKIEALRRHRAHDQCVSPMYFCQKCDGFGSAVVQTNLARLLQAS